MNTSQAPPRPAAPAETAAAVREEQADRYFYRFAMALVRPPQPGRDRVLELGCGAGEVCQKLAALGWKPVGIDINPTNVEAVRAKGFEVAAGDLNAPLPFPDDSFDFATMIEVVEHIVRAEGLMAEVSRILKPGGRLLMTTPNNAFYARRLRAIFGRPPDEEGKHLRFWVRRRLREEFEKRNLELLARRSFGYYPLMNKLLLRRRAGARKLRVRVPYVFETLFAEHFCWILENRKP